MNKKKTAESHWFMETAKLNQVLYVKNVLTTGARRRPEGEVCRGY